MSSLSDRKTFQRLRILSMDESDLDEIIEFLKTDQGKEANKTFFCSEVLHQLALLTAGKLLSL